MISPSDPDYLDLGAIFTPSHITDAERKSVYREKANLLALILSEGLVHQIAQEKLQEKARQLAQELHEMEVDDRQTKPNRKASS